MKMVRKRPGGVVDLSSSTDSDNGGSEDVQCSQSPFKDDDFYPSLSDTQLFPEVCYLFVSFLVFSLQLYALIFCA